MRPAALLTSICALSTSVTAIQFASSVDLNDLTASAAQLYSHIATENPTQIYSQANSIATGALATLSQMAATASGPLKSQLLSEYTSLKSQLNGVQATASSALHLTGTHGGGGSPTGYGASGSAPSGSAVPSTGLAADTVVPLAAVGVGMAVLGFL